MKLQLVQKDIGNTDIEPYLISARDNAVELICFGELATTGCLYKKREVESLESLTGRLSAYDFQIMIGCPLLRQGELRNCYLHYHKGESQFYYKINLFPDMNELDVYKAGEKPGIMETGSRTVGVSICYDIRFPELYSRLKKLGAKLLVIPAAFPVDRIDQWRQMVIERAKETNLPVVAINSVGRDSRYTFGGCSMAVNAAGEVLAEADRVSETVLTVDI